ncbi:MAG: hypothetical protein ACOYLQ_09465 [Hyphomicrobiaceae bacterium]
MSLARTALRIATTMALSNGYQSPFPTLAGDRVFDSRQDPIAGVNPGDLVPMIVVYTDDEKGDSISSNNGGPPFERRVSLTIEISLGMVGEQIEGTEIWTTSLPQTEPELDAALDLFEAQIERVFRDGRSTWGRELNKVARRIESWQSSRFIEREAQIRLAARQIVCTVALPLEDDPTVITTSSPSNTPPTITPTLPAPLGPLLTAIIAADGPYAASAQAIEDLLLNNANGLGPIVLPDLERVRFIESDQAVKNNANVARGPRAAGVAQADLPTS